jgi:RNA polymerase sigma factor (sigma-70 family)
VGDWPYTRETHQPAETCAARCKEFVRAIAQPRSLLHGTSMAVTEASHAAARALDDLYRRHGGEVYRYALAILGNHADAEDVTQTTFLNAYRALEQGVHPRKPANWLLTIASNAIKQRFRQEQSRPREVELDRDVPSAGGDEDAPSVGELLTALSKIPPQQRQALVLREFEGRSYKEIAEILGITTSALETLLFRARRSLSEELASQLTCTEAQQAISRAADGRLGRKEKRRLREHIRECPDCAQFARLQQRNSKALKGLALVPIPLSLTLVKGFEGSAAAATLPAAAGAAAAGAGAAGVGAGAGGAGLGGAAAGGGGLFAGGVAVKAAAVVAAVGVAGGATVEGVKHIKAPERKAPPAAATLGKSHELHSQRAAHASAHGLAHGKAVARGQTGAVPPGLARRGDKTTLHNAAAHNAKANVHKATAQGRKPKPRALRPHVDARPVHPAKEKVRTQPTAHGRASSRAGPPRQSTETPSVEPTQSEPAAHPNAAAAHSNASAAHAKKTER